jgi:hypothetical protein
MQSYIYGVILAFLLVFNLSDQTIFERRKPVINTVRDSKNVMTLRGCYERDPVLEPTIHEVSSFNDYAIIVKLVFETYLPALNYEERYYAFRFISTALAVDGFSEHPIVDRILFFLYLQSIWDGYVGAEFSSPQYESAFLGMQRLLKFKNMYPLPNSASIRKQLRVLWLEQPCKTRYPYGGTHPTIPQFKISAEFLNRYFEEYYKRIVDWERECAEDFSHWRGDV